MTTGDVDNPRIWQTGEMWTAPLGASTPTTSSSAWTAADAEWETIGLLSEDGLTESRSEEVTDHYGWGGTLVRTTRSKHKRTFKAVALEDNDTVFGLVNPGSHTVTSGETTRTVEIPRPYIRAFGWDMTDGTIRKRIIVPRGEVSQVGDRVMTETGIAMVELTVSVYPDEDDVLYREITNDTQAQGAILS